MKKIKKPRILMLYDFPIKGGGSGVYVKYLSIRLREAYKYDVAVAAPDRFEIGHDIPLYRLKVPQIPVFIGRPGLEKSKKYNELSTQEIIELYNAYTKETLRVIDDFKPDVIHIHHMMVHAWPTRLFKSLLHKKVIITSHGSCMQAISKDRRYYGLTKDALRAADIITVVSGDTRTKLFRMFGKEFSDKTRTIPGGVRMSLFPEKKNASSLNEVARKYKINRDENMVLFSGRLVSEKGVEYFIKAAKNISGQIIIAGDGPQKEKLADLIKTNKLTNVILLGYIEHSLLINLYYLADVFVSPSVWDDPMPLTIMEAMAAGLPVVVTRRGGIPIAVKDGYNGYFVKVRNPADIAEKVNILLKNKDLRKKMGTRGRQVVKDKFTWTKIAERVHRLYLSVSV